MIDFTSSQPGESRHETALQYIRQAEASGGARVPPAQRLTDAQIDEVASALFYAGEPADSMVMAFRQQWLESIARPLARAIEAAIVPQWLPIDTAPRDGTEILMTNGVDVSSGEWFKGHDGTYDSDGAPNCDERDAGWMDWSGGMQPDPTHWMPLPPPPAQKDTP